MGINLTQKSQYNPTMISYSYSLSLRKIRYLGYPFRRQFPFKIDGFALWFLLEMVPQANILESEVMINSLHASSVWCGIFGIQAMCCSELKLVLPLLQGEKSFCLFCLNQ